MHLKLQVDELWLLILGELDHRHIVRCRAVCSYWRTLIDYSAPLTYKVWLGIHGKVDRPWASKHLSIAERMSQLVLSEEIGWRTLTFPRYDELKLHLQQIRIMGFGGTCECSGGPRQIDDGLEITLGALPSAASSQPFTFLPAKELDSTHPEYTQDPALDVMIFLASATNSPPVFGVRSLRDPRRPHKYAAVRTLDTTGLVPDDGREWSFSKTALVSDKFVLKADSEGLSILCIWNWVHGTLLVCMELPRRPSFVCGGLSLVSKNTFILPVIAVNTGSTPSAYVEVYQFDEGPLSFSSSQARCSPPNSPSHTPKQPRLMRTFLLPEMSPSLMNERIEFDFYCFSLFHNSLSLAREDTQRTRNPMKSESSDLIGGLDRPCVPQDEDRVCHLIMDVHFARPGGAHAVPRKSHCYDFFVYNSTFTCPSPSLTSRPPTSLSPSKNPLGASSPIVPWSQWGPKNAAAFCSLASSHQHIDVDICWHARGDRVACTSVDLSGPAVRIGDRTWQMRVLDFRRDRVRRAEIANVNANAELLLSSTSSPTPSWPAISSLKNLNNVLESPEGRKTATAIVKRSSTDPNARPVGYEGDFAFKEWPIKAEMPYIETVNEKKYTAVWVDVEMDGEHIVANICRDSTPHKVDVEILSM